MINLVACHIINAMDSLVLQNNSSGNCASTYKTAMGESIDEEHLILQVQQYPMLYDQQNRHYSDKEKKEAAWKEIGGALRFPANECRIKWQTLRGSFRRAHKLATLSKSGQASKKRKLWRWYELMTYLVPYMDDGGANLSDDESSIYGAINENDEVLETPEFSADPVEEEEVDSSDALKASQNVQNIQNKNKLEKSRTDMQNAFMKYLDYRSIDRAERPKTDALKVFFQCMYETVRGFPLQYQTKAKCAVFKAVTEIETQLHNVPVLFNHNNIPQHLLAAMSSASAPSPPYVQQSVSSSQQSHQTADGSAFNHSSFESKLDVFSVVDSRDGILDHSINLSDSPVKLEEN